MPTINIIIFFLFCTFGPSICANENLRDFVLHDTQYVEEQEDSEDSQILELTKYVTGVYMKQCLLTVIWHTSFRFNSGSVNFSLQTLLKSYPYPIICAKVSKKNILDPKLLQPTGSQCRGFLIFIKEIGSIDKLIGNHTTSKVTVVTASSPWNIKQFLTGQEAKGIVNLLVIATTGSRDIVITKGEQSRAETFVNMYTHSLFVDGVGGSKVVLLTSWSNNSLSRNVNLFPQKLTKGFNGRQLAVVVSEQAPFVIKKKLQLSDDEDKTKFWDGIEVRLLRLFAHYLNYTIEIKEAPPTTNTTGPTEAVASLLNDGVAELGLSGAYRSMELPPHVAFSAYHSIDCAAFLTRSSTALPRYRAILGPFHWHVWLALIITYFIAILPLTFAEKHSLMYLWDHPWHLETMFWYVFGYFTNLFTFRGKSTWTRSDKIATRLMVGWYWCFSIIVTACYTGSIIAFITLYVYPPVIDTVSQLLQDNYRVGSLTTGGWGEWLSESEHEPTKWLLRDLELVPHVHQGFRNVTKSFYLPLIRPYTFLLGRAQLEYVIKTNYTLQKSKDLLHVSQDCFIPFGVSFLYPKSAAYRPIFDGFILRATQTGLTTKVYRDLQWELQRSSTGQRLQAGSGASLRDAISQDRRLTLDDTQGMFLLLGAGFLIAATAFWCEISTNSASTGSWKFWKWQPRRYIDIVLNKRGPWLQRAQALFSPQKPEPQTTSEFVFKKYDSRVLYSQYQNVDPLKFVAEDTFAEGSYMPTTVSRPKSQPCRRSHKRFETVIGIRSSCPDLSSNAFEKDQNFTTNQESMTKPSLMFNSTGTLPSFVCREVMGIPFSYERPQTSQI